MNEKEQMYLLVVSRWNGYVDIPFLAYSATAPEVKDRLNNYKKDYDVSYHVFKWDGSSSSDVEESFWNYIKND